VSSEEVLGELQQAVGLAQSGGADTTYRGAFSASASGGSAPDVPMYRVDAVVRRAPALQATRVAHEPVISY